MSKQERKAEEAQQEQYPIEQVTQIDSATYEVIDLPTMDDMTDAIVYKNVKDLCRGFSFDANEAMDKKFQGADQIVSYVQATEADIKEMCYRAETNERMHHAAAMARYWYMAYSIDKALDNGNYGTNVCQQIAAKLKKSVPMVYSIRHVGERLTATECYLLGIRMISTTTLRSLAAIADDNHRKGLIAAFINAYSDTHDPDACERVRRQFISAVNMGLDPRFVLTSTSDPVSGGSDVEVSESYTGLMKQFDSLEGLMNKVNKERFLEDFCGACADFSITDSVPDAAAYVKGVKERANALKARCLAAKNNLDDIVVQLDSLSGVEVISSEATDSSSNK